MVAFELGVSLTKIYLCIDKQTREDAVEHLLVYLSGRGDLAEIEKQDMDKDGEGATLEAEEAAVAWNDVKLPKAFQEEQLNVLWQGCFYCTSLSSASARSSERQSMKLLKNICVAH